MIMQQFSYENEALPLTVGKIKDEYEDSKESHNAGEMSPPLSPASASSSAPTMVPMSCSDRDFRDRPTSISPHRNSPTNLQQSLPGLQGLHNFQNYRNLHSLQSQIAAFVGLQGGMGNANINSLLNTHFQQTHRQEKQNLPPAEHLTSPPLHSNTPPSGLCGSGNSANGSTNSQGVVPQMVLTSGQVAEGVQGAQLLIPTSQGIAVQPILTIPLGQTTTMSGSSMTTTSSQINSLAPLFQSHQQQSSPSVSLPSPFHHHQHSHTSSAVSSPMPPSSASSSSAPVPHPLLGVLPPSMFHGMGHGASHNNNNNTNSTNNNNIGHLEKNKMPLPLSSPVQDTISSLSARMNRDYWHHPTQSSRYSPDFLDTHDQPTINQATGNVIDGVNLEDIKEFAKAFKLRRLSLGLTQTQVGQALSITEGPAYSQSAICRFEKLDITPKSAQKIKPVLEHWMQDAEDRYKNGHHNITDFMGNESSKKRKRRTSFTPQALEILNAHFERNTHPSGADITAMGEQLGYEREVVRIWFCNKRQALKNTVRMMSRPVGSLPPNHHLDNKHDDPSLR